MKLPMKWISEYAPIGMSAEEYQNKMIMIGNGVEGYEPMAQFDGVVVGRVLTCENHPDSDHLHVTTVDVGAGEPLQIVCGAPNCRAGILTPVALVGASLPGGMKIKKGKLRGVESCGMLCSGDELGIPAELYPHCGSEGILIFNEEHPLGADVREIVGMNDTIMDFEVLANRPDCLSVWGIARETAVACGSRYTHPEIQVQYAGGDIHDEVKISVEAPDLCPRYVARVIKNIRVKESPMWMKKALHGAGMRSINNIVDITNYVMLETGHPMHAFDLDMVEGREIIVRRAAEGEHITTLDGKEHPLTAGQLAICDAKKPSCVAGIMGGEESEITEKTANVMFECAVFDRASVRLTARALGIRTESSGRFEKGVSVRTAMEAIDRACQLINMLDAGDVVNGTIDIYPDPAPVQIISASCEQLARRTGVDIPAETIGQILKDLHFGVEQDGDAITVTVPAYRQDVEGPADLSEEALRVYGYDHIPATLLRGETTPGGLSAGMALRQEIARVLNGLGCYEIINFSFVSPATLDKLGLDADDPRREMLAIRNPLGEDTSVMRTSLMPDMLKTLALNMNRGNEKASLYETGVSFDKNSLTAEGLPTEHPVLCIGQYGKDTDFFTLRGIVERVLNHLGIAAVIEAGGDSYYHPGRKAVMKCGGQVICTLGEIHPDIRERFEMPSRCCAAEIDLEAVMALKAPMGAVKPMPRYPAVTRDLALVMDESTQTGPLLADMKKAGGALLEDAGMFDVYRSAQLGENKKSVAFSFVFRGADHTLAEDEVTAAMNKVLKAAGKHGAVIRA